MNTSPVSENSHVFKTLNEIFDVGYNIDIILKSWLFICKFYVYDELILSHNTVLLEFYRNSQLIEIWMLSSSVAL
jgi:hypothetical protein